MQPDATAPTARPRTVSERRARPTRRPRHRDGRGAHWAGVRRQHGVLDTHFDHPLRRASSALSLPPHPPTQTSKTPNASCCRGHVEDGRCGQGVAACPRVLFRWPSWPAKQAARRISDAAAKGNHSEITPESRGSVLPGASRGGLDLPQRLPEPSPHRVPATRERARGCSISSSPTWSPEAFFLRGVLSSPGPQCLQAPRPAPGRWNRRRRSR